MPNSTDRQAAISLIRAVHRRDVVAMTAALDHDHPAELTLAVVGHLLYLLWETDTDPEVWLDDLAVKNLQAADPDVTA